MLNSDNCSGEKVKLVKEIGTTRGRDSQCYFTKGNQKTFEQRPKGSKYLGRRVFQENNMCKGLEVGACLLNLMNNKEASMPGAV